MRALLIAIALSGVAHAAPDEVSESDWSALELAQAHVDTAQAQLETVRAKLALKYRIDDGDGVDAKTRKITRKPASKAPEKVTKKP